MLTRLDFLFSGGGEEGLSMGSYVNEGVNGGVCGVFSTVEALGYNGTHISFSTTLPSFLVSYIVSVVTTEADSTSPSTMGPIPRFRLKFLTIVGSG
jgi:hypothetical protein